MSLRSDIADALDASDDFEYSEWGQPVLDRLTDEARRHDAVWRAAGAQRLYASCDRGLDALQHD